MEVDTKKLDLNAYVNGVLSKNRQQIYFIRIGVLDIDSPRKIEMQKDSDGQMIITPPQLNWLRIKQQSFRQCVEQLKWNYLLGKEDEGGKDDNDKDDCDDDDKENDDDGKINASSTPTSNKKRSTIPSRQETMTIWLSPIWRSRIHI
jgi:hypothetical protein